MEVTGTLPVLTALKEDFTIHGVVSKVLAVYMAIAYMMIAMTLR